MEKRGVSPIIATIMLIGLVVAIGLVVFAWARGFSQEAVTKFDGKNVKIVCEDLNFKADYSGGQLFISNFGNVPIYSFDVRVDSKGSHETKDIKDLFPNGNWPADYGLKQGGVFQGTGSLGDVEKITLTPVLLGLGDGGKETSQNCDKRHSNEVFIE